MKTKLKKILKLFVSQLKAFKPLKKKNTFDIFDLRCLVYISSKSERKFDEFTSKFSRILLVEKSSIENFIPNTRYTSHRIVKSNAQIYILDVNTAKNLANERLSSNYIALPLLSIVLNIRSLFKIFRTGKYVISGMKKLPSTHLIFQRLKKIEINDSTRRYIPNKYSRQSFMAHLKEQSVNALVLRWFDKFDEFEGNIDEDIDVLIEDDDLDKLAKILDENVGVLPIDVYSVGGMRNSSYAGVPYYPFQLSKDLLRTKVLSSLGFFIPNSTNYKIALIYHAVFHKSITSGIPLDLSSTDKLTEDIDHNYLNIIKGLFVNDSDILPEYSLEGLYAFLKESNAIPSYDLILKLSSIKNQDRWYTRIKTKIEEEIAGQYKYIKGLAVFIIRERAFENINIPLVIEIFNSFGFEILNHNPIEEERLLSVKQSIRGGNWSKGPFEISGGDPVYYFVTYDPFHVDPQEKQLVQFPHLENRKVIALKGELRTCFQKDAPVLFNGVHSSDNFYESIDYMLKLYANESIIRGLLDQSHKIKMMYASKYQIQEDLSRKSSRAKVRLVNSNDKLVIEKTYKKDKERYLEREMAFLKKFSKEKEIPNFIMRENNSLFLEYFENATDFTDRSLKISPYLIKQLRRILKVIFDQNMTLLDVNPSNVLVVNNSVKLIDFEFARPYKKKPESLQDAYELSAIPEDFTGDIPKGHAAIVDAYDLFWKDRLKLTKHQFISTNNSIYMSLLMKINYVKFRIFK